MPLPVINMPHCRNFVAVYLYIHAILYIQMTIVMEYVTFIPNLPSILSQYGPLDAVALGGRVLGESGAADVPDRPQQVENLRPRRLTAAAGQSRL